MGTETEHARTVAALLARARQRTGLSLRELARRAETSHATLSAYEKGRKVPSAATFLRILQACDHPLMLRHERRIRCYDGIPRGEELEQVLALAECFPNRVIEPLPSSPFPRTADVRSR